MNEVVYTKHAQEQLIIRLNLFNKASLYKTTEDEIKKRINEECARIDLYSMELEVNKEITVKFKDAVLAFVYKISKRKKDKRVVSIITVAGIDFNAEHKKKENNIFYNKDRRINNSPEKKLFKLKKRKLIESDYDFVSDGYEY